MISAFGLVGECEPGLLAAPHSVESVHLTLLKADGSDKADIKPNKLIVGSPGAFPIVLSPPNDLLELGICEGVEDGLTAYQETGHGVWSAGPAGRLPGLADLVPNYIERVTIYAHDDKGGRDHATALAQALDRRGIEVFVDGL